MKNIIKNLFNLIFIICFGYILYNSIFHNGVNLFLWDKTSVIVGVIVNILIMLLIYKYVNEKQKINTKIIIPVLLFIIFIFQCYVGNLFKVQPNWDMKELFNNTVEYVNGGQEYLHYLYRYPNNIAIQIIYIVLFRISSLIKIISHYDIGILFNIITIDIALVLTYLVSKKLFDTKKALMVFIMIASMTPIYLFTPIVYTDTMSMLFPLLVLYLYLLSKEAECRKNKYLLYLTMGIIIYIGAIIKVTTLIMTIAIIIYELINIDKKYFISLISTISITLIICSTSGVLATRIIFNKWNEEEYKKEQFPLTHWVMMGLGDVGKYSSEDVEFTASFDNIKTKKENNMKTIEERMKKQTMNSIRRKLMYTWGDGTYYAVNTLDYDAVNNGTHQDFVFKRGKHHLYYQYYTQIQHMTMITLMVILSVISLTKKEINKEFILRLTIFGLFLFLFIWETRSRYLINYLPIMQIISFISIEELYNIFEKIKSKMKNE